jgi:hypothetical protein
VRRPVLFSFDDVINFALCYLFINILPENAMSKAISMNDSLESVLETAEAQTRVGHYFDAIKILENYTVPTPLSSDHWFGLVLTSTARNKLHVQDNQGALDCINRISNELKHANPKVAAECHLVEGMLARRQSHHSWKSGDATLAESQARLSINSFLAAEQSARRGLEDRLIFNAILNRIYAEGLLAAICSQSIIKNRELIVSAISAEAGSRDYTPQILKDNIPGLIIIADLALGANIKLPDVFLLSKDVNFFLDCRKVLGNQGRTYWADLLLNEIKYAKNLTPEMRARALVLGSKFLLLDAEYGIELEKLMLTYLTYLRYCYKDLKSMESNPSMLKCLIATIEKFPKEITKQALAISFG